MLDQSRTKGAARLVLVVLAEHADGAGVSWPGEALIAHEANIDERTVRRVLPVIVQEGELEVRRWRKGGNEHNAYRVVLGAPDPVDIDRLARAGVLLAAPFSTAGQDARPCASTSGHPHQPRPGKSSGPARAGSLLGTTNAEPSPSGGSPDGATAQDLVAFYISENRRLGAETIPTVASRIGREAKALLGEGTSPVNPRRPNDRRHERTQSERARELCSGAPAPPTNPKGDRWTLCCL